MHSGLPYDLLLRNIFLTRKTGLPNQQAIFGSHTVNSCSSQAVSEQEMRSANQASGRKLDLSYYNCNTVNAQFLCQILQLCICSTWRRWNLSCGCRWRQHIWCHELTCCCVSGSCKGPWNGGYITVFHHDLETHCLV